MKILQSVVVKQVLTDKTKEAFLSKYQATKSQLEKECDHLRFEYKKLEKNNRAQSTNLKRNFEKEIKNREEKIQLIEFQIEQLHMLPLGSELKEKEMQAIIEVNVGDVWNDLQASRTIVIKDGIVVEIR